MLTAAGQEELVDLGVCIYKKREMCARDLTEDLQISIILSKYPPIIRAYDSGVLILLLPIESITKPNVKLHRPRAFIRSLWAQCTRASETNFGWGMRGHRVSDSFI